MDSMICILLELYRGARELTVPEFQELALALIKPVLRFDSGIWGAGEVSADAGLIVHSLHLHKQPEEWSASYDEFKDRDRVTFEMNENVGAICNFHFPEIDTGPSNAVNRAHCKKFDTQNALATISLDPQVSSQDFIALFRAKPRDRYSEQERRAAELLMPHMVEAGRVNRLLWLNQMTTSTLAQRGARAIGGLQGRLYTYDAEFENLIRLEWPAWLPPLLPDRLLASLRTASALRFAGARIVVGARLIRDMMFFHVRKRSPVDALTPAERRVANLVAHGHPYKEVANKLNVSTATVRNQLHSVYQKLDIRNKAALAQCLGEEGMG